MACQPSNSTYFFLVHGFWPFKWHTEQCHSVKYLFLRAGMCRMRGCVLVQGPTPWIGLTCEETKLCGLVDCLNFVLHLNQHIVGYDMLLVTVTRKGFWMFKRTLKKHRLLSSVTSACSMTSKTARRLNVLLRFSLIPVWHVLQFYVLNSRHSNSYCIHERDPQIFSLKG